MINIEPLTYTLVPKHVPAYIYFTRVEQLVNEIVQTMIGCLEPLVTRFQADEQIENTPLEQILVELLLLGVWVKRANTNPDLAPLIQLKQAVDHYEFSKDHIYQSQKARGWLRFLESQPETTLNYYWDFIEDATQWFDQRSCEILAPYTEQVNSFVSNYEPGTDGAEDIFNASQQLEYHLNMVGAEILNGVFRDRFRSTDHKLVVLPGCLRANAQYCVATPWIMGFRCEHCLDSCQISIITKLGLKHDFQVSFVVHQSSFATQAEGLHSWGHGQNYGVLGVACVLSLLEGGFLLESQDIPAQCVPLDFCACLNHWGGVGPTHVNMERLVEKIL